LQNGWDGYMGYNKCKRVDTIYREKRTNNSRVHLLHDGVTTDISGAWENICKEVHQELEDENYDIGLVEEKTWIEF